MTIIDINGNQRECVRVYLDDKWPGFVSVDFESKLRTGYKHTEWFPLEDFGKNNPNLENLMKGAPKPAPEVVGVASSSTDTSLNDTTQKWEENAYAGFPLWISRGKGEGQIRTVLSNTKNSVIVDKKWDVKPGRFSQYVLSHNVHEMKPAGNILPQEKIAKLERKARAWKNKKKQKPLPQKALKTNPSPTRP